MKTTYRAMQVTRPGVLELVERKTPTPGAGEVLIEVGACGICGADAADIEGELGAAYVHDWQSDPYARGAYSYVTVGGMSARKALAAPFEDTLYFAGEAADYEGETGTVAGNRLQSGERSTVGPSSREEKLLEEADKRVRRGICQGC